MNKERRSRLEKVKEQLSALVSDLESIRDEEQESFDNLPEGLQQSEKGGTMQSNVDYMEEAIGSVQEVVDTEIGNAPDGSLTLVLRFADANKLTGFVDEFLPVNSVAVEADSLDFQKIDRNKAYVVATRAKADGRKSLESGDEDPSSEMAEQAQAAVDNLDNVE